MNRKELIAFCNDRIFPQVDFRLFDNGDLWNTVKLVSAWRIGKKKNVEMIPKVVNGFLYINGDAVGRIARPAPKMTFDENAYRMEGRILARQEID